MSTPDASPIPEQFQASAPRGGVPVTQESRLLWASSEGQVVNLWVYIVAFLTCWAIIPIFWALYRYLKTAYHRYEVTDQRLIELSGILVKHMDTLELYRVVDIKVDGTAFQSIFGLGQVRLTTHDQSSPTVTINAISRPVEVATLIRDAVEQCRVNKGVRTFDS